MIQLLEDDREHGKNSEFYNKSMIIYMYAWRDLFFKLG